MSETIRLLLTAGVTFLAAGLGAIVAPLLKARLDRDLESRKAVIARQTTLLEKQVEIVAELFARTREVTALLLKGAQTSTVKEDQMLDTNTRFLDFHGYFYRQELFLPSEIINAFRGVSNGFALTLNHLSRVSGAHFDDAKTQAWKDLNNYISQELEPLVAHAEAVSRSLVQPES
jgi:hypothetical protein